MTAIDRSDEQARLAEALRALRDKSNLQVSCHSTLADRYGRWNTVFLSLILALSASLLGLTFISEQFVQTTLGVAPDTLKWIMGIASIATFVAGLLLSQWDFANKAAQHREAVHHYFVIVNRIRALLESNTSFSEATIRELRADYERTEALPLIPERQFLRLKQQHLRKVAISRELDKIPNVPLNEIKQRLEQADRRKLADSEGAGQRNGPVK